MGLLISFQLIQLSISFIAGYCSFYCICSCLSSCMMECMSRWIASLHVTVTIVTQTKICYIKNHIYCHRLLTECEESTSVVTNNPGCYSSVCIELNIDGLAVNTLLQSHHVNDIEGNIKLLLIGIYRNNFKFGGIYSLFQLLYLYKLSSDSVVHHSTTEWS